MTNNTAWFCPSREVFSDTILGSSRAKELLNKASLSGLYGRQARIDLNATTSIYWSFDENRWESTTKLPAWVLAPQWRVIEDVDDLGCNSVTFNNASRFGWFLKLSGGDDCTNEHTEAISELILNYLEENVDLQS